MNHQKKSELKRESDFANERSVDSMAKSIKNLLHGIRNSVRRLIRNVAFVTQVSAAASGAIGCEAPPGAEWPDHPAQCASKIFPSEPDNTPQCDDAMSDSPVVKEVAVCFMRWSDTYDLTDEIRAKLEAEFDLATRFFDEVTFGRDHYEFNLIDSGSVWAGPSPVKQDDDVNFAIQACASQIDDFDKVDTFVVFPSFDDLQATGERKTVSTPVGDKELGVIRLPHYTEISDTLYPDLRNLRHEIGHASFSFKHAVAYVCYQQKYHTAPVTYNPAAEFCNPAEYGNPYDLMGGGLITPSSTDIYGHRSSDIYGHRSSDIYGHPCGFEKSLSGLVTVTTIAEDSGKYPLAAVEVPCSNVPQLLRIPYAKLPLCLEYRQPTGFDAVFSEDNIDKELGFKVGLPPDGCIFLSICSNDSTILGYSTNLRLNQNGATFLLRPNATLSNGSYPEQRDHLAACVPRDGFCDSNLGVDVSYRQSTTNPNAVMVHVSGVDETRLAKLPNLILSRLKGVNFAIGNVSETGESVGTFDIQISGKRISDGQFELIETRTVDGLPLFGKVAINFSPDELEALKLIYSEVRVTADSGNVVGETDESDNEETYGIGISSRTR